MAQPLGSHLSASGSDGRRAETHRSSNPSTGTFIGHTREQALPKRTRKSTNPHRREGSKTDRLLHLRSRLCAHKLSRRDGRAATERGEPDAAVPAPRWRSWRCASPGGPLTLRRSEPGAANSTPALQLRRRRRRGGSGRQVCGSPGMC